MSGASLFFAPHERFELVEAYADVLTPDQIDIIASAPDTAHIRLDYKGRDKPVTLTLIVPGSA